MKNITIKEISKIANLSQMTISRVINNHKHVKKETREKVEKIIKKLNFEPNYFARNIKNKKSKTIGLIIGDLENPFYSQLAKGVINVAEKLNYNVIVCNSNYNNNLGKRYIDMLISKGIAGLIICTIILTKADINKINLRNIPFVLIGSKIYKQDVNCIISDPYYGSCLATKYLIELGHKKIYFLRSDCMYNANERARAFKDTLINYNLEYSEENISKPLANKKDIYREFTKFIENRKDFTAIIACNDFMAISAIKIILDKKLRIPEDISIIGYDNIDVSSILRVPLTTINVPKRVLGKLAIKRLIKIIENPESNEKPKIINIKPNLIIRESCKKLL